MRKNYYGNMDSSRAFDGLFGADDASFIEDSWKNWGDILDPVDQRPAAVSSPKPPPAPIKSDSDPVPKARELPPQTPKPRDSSLNKLLFTPVRATPSECPSAAKLGLTTPGLKLKGITNTAAKEPQAAPNKGSIPTKAENEGKRGSGASLEKAQEDEAADSLKRRQVPPTHSEKRAKIEFAPKTPARPPEKPKLFCAQKPHLEASKQHLEALKPEPKAPQTVRPPAKVLEELAFIENYIATAESAKQLPVATAPQGEAEAVRFEEYKRAIVEVLSIRLEAESLAADFFAMQRVVGAEELLDQAVEVLVLDC